MRAGFRAIAIPSRRSFDWRTKVLTLSGIPVDTGGVFTLGLKDRPACPPRTIFLSDLHTDH